ncbi:hypothetical protein LX36DRAFT_251655 [Colletotrichum falcatum]|nr:hypothetical protein LX36DRAFT_251655 [Colletotrichum falcatum]
MLRISYSVLRTLHVIRPMACGCKQPMLSCDNSPSFTCGFGRGGGTDGEGRWEGGCTRPAALGTFPLPSCATARAVRACLRPWSAAATILLAACSHVGRLSRRGGGVCKIPRLQGRESISASPDSRGRKMTTTTTTDRSRCSAGRERHGTRRACVVFRILHHRVPWASGAHFAFFFPLGGPPPPLHRRRFLDHLAKCHRCTESTPRPLPPLGDHPHPAEPQRSSDPFPLPGCNF